MRFITNRLPDAAAKKSDMNPQKGCAEIKGQVGRCKGDRHKKAETVREEDRYQYLSFCQMQILTP